MLEFCSEQVESADVGLFEIEEGFELVEMSQLLIDLVELAVDSMALAVDLSWRLINFVVLFIWFE